MAGRKARRGGGRATVPNKTAAATYVTQTLFTSQVPVTLNASDGQALTVGTRFTPDVDGTIDGVRVYRATTAPTTLIVLLYTSGGTELARATISSPTTGWNTGTFASPVAVTAATVYMAAYFSNSPYVASSSLLPITNSHLTTNGSRWIYNATATAPTNVPVAGYAYFADPVFTYNTASVPPPPIWGTKPDATNTGVPAGTTLTTYSGPLNITTNNTVLDSLDITGELDINATGVTITKCKIHGTGNNTIGIDTHGNTVNITDCEIYGFATGAVYAGLNILRCHFHDLTFDGMKMSSNSTIKDSYIHLARPDDGAHFDGIQIQDGVTNVLIQGNNFDMTDSVAGVNDGYLNSCLFLTPDLGPSTAGPLTVTGNWFNGGQFSVFALDGNNGAYFISNLSITNNRFGRNQAFGELRVTVPATLSGNVHDDDETPVSPS